MKTKNKKCIYCGAQAVSRDHVPPENIFYQPLPKNLLTVPSCSNCNLGDSKDDENFRNMLSMRHDTGDNPSASKARESLLRSLEKPEAPGLRKSILSNLTKVELLSPGGIYLGKSAAYDVDLDRLNHVVRRITIGLRFKHLKTPWSDDLSILVRCLSNIESEEGKRVFADSSLQIIRAGRKCSIGERAVSYCFAVASDCSEVSAWVMQFYETETFISLVCPKSASTA